MGEVKCLKRSVYQIRNVHEKEEILRIVEKLLESGKVLWIRIDSRMIEWESLEEEVMCL